MQAVPDNPSKNVPSASASPLLIVSSHFPPRQSAGVYRTLRFARYLPELDWNVHVLTLAPDSYEDGANIDQALSSTVPESVAIHRTKAVYPMRWLVRSKEILRRPAKESNGASRPLDSGPNSAVSTPKRRGVLQQVKDSAALRLMTPDRTIGWTPFATRCGRRVVRRAGIRAIYSSGPPWTNHVVARKLTTTYNLPWVADFRDPWVVAGRSITQSDSWVGRKHRRLEHAIVEAAGFVILNTDRSREGMIRRYAELPAEKFVVISNGYDPADYEVERPPRDKPRDRLVIAHAGSFHGPRTVAPLIEALGNVCRRGELRRDQITLQLIGALRQGRTVEQRQVQSAELEGVVEVLPPVLHQECLQRMSDADVLLLVQIGAALCIPGKVFEYIALGKPILTLAGEGATADLVRNAGLGVCVAPDDPPAIESALLELSRQFQSGEPLPGPTVEVQDSYDGRRLTCELDALFCQLIPTTSRG